MTKPAIIGALAGLALGALPLAGCARHGVHHAVQPVVGAWVVRDAGAPFPYHMYVFNADGTTQQANPDAGDPHTSDSDGKGLWVADGEGVRGKWVEVVADRTTREYAGRTEVSYAAIHVNKVKNKGYELKARLGFVQPGYARWNAAFLRTLS